MTSRSNVASVTRTGSDRSPTRGFESPSRFKPPLRPRPEDRASRSGERGAAVAGARACPHAMVPPTSPRTTVARRPGPVSGLGRRGAASADEGRPGDPVLRTIRELVPHRGGAGPSAGGTGPQGLARRGILRPRPPPACGGETPCAGAGRPAPVHRRGARVPSGRGAVHRAGGRLDRVRPSVRGAGGERSARRGPVDTGGRPGAGPDRSLAAREHPLLDRSREGAGHVQRSGDGARRDGLLADPTELPRVSGGVRVPGAPRVGGPGTNPGAGAAEAATGRSGGGRRPHGVGWAVARPTPSRLRPAPRPLGVPGRADRATGAARGGGPTRASGGDGARGGPSGPARCRPPRLQPLHRGTARLRWSVPRRARERVRAHPEVADPLRVRPPPGPEGHGEGGRSHSGGAGYSFPGFRIPSGSQARFTAPRSATAPSPSSSARNARLTRPIPCSALIVPPRSREARKTAARIRAAAGVPGSTA